MSTYTPNLNLLKKNPLTEGSDVFNIETMMNDNWDKIDSFSALLEASIAPLYSTSSAYAVGAWCTHDGKLYQCTTAIGSGGEAWNASHWTAKSTTELITAVKAAIPSAYASTPAMNGTGSAGSSTQWARGNHVHPTDTSRAPTSHAASGTTYGASSGTNYGHVRLSDSTTSTSSTGGGYAATPAAVKAVNDNLSSYVRPNLLDNAYFVGGGSQQGGGQFPINQRGLTTYSSGENRHTIDRWRAPQNVTVVIVSDGVKISASSTSTQFYQLIENGERLCSKTVTLSAYIDGNVVSVTNTMPDTIPASGTIGSGTTAVNGVSVYLRAASGILVVAFYFASAYTPNTQVKISAVKLEVGSTQTLAHQENNTWVLNEIPSYEEELPKCQRYFYAMNTAAKSYQRFGDGTASSSTNAWVSVFFPTTMRTTPTLTAKGSLQLYRGSTSYAVSGISLDDFGSGTDCATLSVTSSSLTTNYFYQLRAGSDSTARLEFDAEL